MNTSWHSDNFDATPTPNEVEMMASVLEGRHGVFAEHVADFFCQANAHAGDAPKSWAWAAVTQRVRMRATARLNPR